MGSPLGLENADFVIAFENGSWPGPWPPAVSPNTLSWSVRTIESNPVINDPANAACHDASLFSTCFTLPEGLGSRIETQAVPFQIRSVPLPSSFGLFVLGFIALVGYQWRKKLIALVSVGVFK